ncbi:MAG: hypothetical protein E6G95_18045 [Alphaproteobacteria bacterium]|nr:MAG: hypothetical protein E6G95_18045 [Alphaproteobacteria bacterium]
MTSTKRKPARRGKKNSPAAKGPRSGRRPPVVAELPLRQGLLAMATIGAQSFLWLATVVAIIAGFAGAAFGVWSLRPVPAYSSERITTGSAFEATFRVENASAWFALSHLKISCALGRPGTSDTPPVDADQSRIPSRLEPGERAAFTCPFGAVAGGTTNDDLEVALRSEIYFRSDYDEPVIGSFRLTDNRGPFVLDTRLLPPRWTAKPGKD